MRGEGFSILLVLLGTLTAAENPRLLKHPHGSVTLIERADHTLLPILDTADNSIDATEGWARVFYWSSIKSRGKVQRLLRSQTVVCLVPSPGTCEPIEGVRLDDVAFVAVKLLKITDAFVAR